MADSQYHKVVMLCCLASIHNILILESPLRPFWLPDRLQDFVVEPNLVVDPIFGCDVLPVGENLGTLSILLAPLSIGSETGLIDVCGDIAAYTRVSVLEPSAALVYVR